MNKNVGTLDRMLRLLGAAVLIASTFLFPVTALVRVALGVSGVYLAGSAFFGACFGYKLLGRSTCAFAPADRT
jgi:hypothetical protein